jgi:hypothetical protein
VIPVLPVNHQSSLVPYLIRCVLEPDPVLTRRFTAVAVAAVAVVAGFRHSLVGKLPKMTTGSDDFKLIHQKGMVETNKLKTKMRNLTFSLSTETGG